MEKTLCIDFGNTRKKVAVFEADQIIQVIDLGEVPVVVLQEILNEYQPRYSILSSVIEYDAAIDEILESQTRYHKLSYQTQLPFISPVGKPETIGADRLALAAAAVHFFPGKNNLIIGLGSCITYNFINKYNQFLGGGISPGKEMRFKAMHTFTAKLPMTSVSYTPPLIGYDTVTNLQSGVMFGMLAEIDGIIGFYAEKYANFNVVLTGGDTAYFATRLKSRIFADFNFLFKGLYAISWLNDKR